MYSWNPKIGGKNHGCSCKLCFPSIHWYENILKRPTSITNREKCCQMWCILHPKHIRLTDNNSIMLHQHPLAYVPVPRICSIMISSKWIHPQIIFFWGTWGFKPIQLGVMWATQHHKSIIWGWMTWSWNGDGLWQWFYHFTLFSDPNIGQRGYHSRMIGSLQDGWTGSWRSGLNDNNGKKNIGKIEEKLSRISMISHVMICYVLYLIINSNCCPKLRDNPALGSTLYRCLKLGRQNNISW